MSRFVLRAKEALSLPVEAEAISPDHFAGLSQSEIAALTVLMGRRTVCIGDLFELEGPMLAPSVALHAQEAGQINPQGGGTPPEIVIEGDVTHFKRIGQGMSIGRIILHGDAGLHLGAEMRGGEILVHGNTGAWTGAHMVGGMIRVHGDAGPMLGAAYVGEKRGMRGGVIIVDGDAGSRVAERMRRGLIVVQGDCGEFAGTAMIAGSVFVLGRLGARAGAGMKRGTIVAFGGLADALLPTFDYACVYHPGFLSLYLRRLQAWGVPVDQGWYSGSFRRYAGDVNTLGKGEILVYDQH